MTLGIEVLQVTKSDKQGAFDYVIQVQNSAYRLILTVGNNGTYVATNVKARTNDFDKVAKSFNSFAETFKYYRGTDLQSLVEYAVSLCVPFDTECTVTALEQVQPDPSTKAGLDFIQHLHSSVENVVLKKIAEGNWVGFDHHKRVKIDSMYLQTIYERIDFAALETRIAAKLTDKLADVIFHNLATEIGTDVKAILSNQTLRGELRETLQNKLQVLAEKIDNVSDNS